MAIDVIRTCWLFDPFELKLGEIFHPFDCILYIPPLISIHHLCQVRHFFNKKSLQYRKQSLTYHFTIRTNIFPNYLTASDVVLDISSNLHLESGITSHNYNCLIIEILKSPGNMSYFVHPCDKAFLHNYVSNIY